MLLPVCYAILSNELEETHEYRHLSFSALRQKHIFYNSYFGEKNNKKVQQAKTIGRMLLPTKTDEFSKLATPHALVLTKYIANFQGKVDFYMFFILAKYNLLPNSWALLGFNFPGPNCPLFQVGQLGH